MIGIKKLSTPFQQGIESFFFICSYNKHVIDLAAGINLISIFNGYRVFLSNFPNPWHFSGKILFINLPNSFVKPVNPCNVISVPSFVNIEYMFIDIVLSQSIPLFSQQGEQFC